MLPHSTTVERMCRSRSLRRRPKRLSQSRGGLVIDFAYTARGTFVVPSIAHRVDYGALTNLRRNAMALLRRHFLLCAGALAAVCATTSLGAWAQDYPVRPVRVIVP